MTPTAPVLAIRRGLSFWVEDEPTAVTEATFQAIDEGVFNNLELYDSAGMAWPVVAASPVRGPSLLDRLLPWRRVQVVLHIGDPVRRDVPEIVTRLCEIVQGESGFDWQRGPAPAELVGRFRAARSPGELIQVARQIE